MSDQTTPAQLAALVVDRVLQLPDTGKRRLIAVAGPPASGKSTLSAAIVDKLLLAGTETALLSMDGFHLDNGILNARGLLHRKGAPDTFDLPGLRSLLERLREEQDLFGPSFDRKRDISIGSSVHYHPAISTVIVEGNYLLTDIPNWRDLNSLWDMSVYMHVDSAELHRRLRARWLALGLTEADTLSKISENDALNSELVRTKSRPADITLSIN